MVASISGFFLLVQALNVDEVINNNSHYAS
jgi:hypothetical protein